MSEFPKGKKLVSIIMPAYNCEKFVDKAINSVLSQTYNNWELIVIDDASKDNTVSIVEEFSDLDNRIHFYKNEENKGVSATRNRGISIAKGEWIAFLDSDDLWDSSKLEKQMIVAERCDAKFLFTGSSFINEEGNSYKGVFEVPSKVSYKSLRNHNVISCSSVLISKLFFSNIKMEDDSMHEDYAVWLKVLKIEKFAYGINEPLLIYRISRSSKSGNKIKTLRMTYKVFRFVGENKVNSIYFTFRHVLSSVLKKYIKIKLVK
ncbi:glycosyltransferase family 2 protein [Paenibacillus sp. NRS-1760]|uniref:glycosyltransferase family 2 protein n=1 Tax=Paenibacillus sp. NRS-1760 TaxID=3233902 RepID=UPI003D270C42